MWRDLTMQQRSDLMQMTGIFDPVRLRQEYDAYLIVTQDQDYQEEPNEYKKGGSIHIKHPGRLTALKKRTGKTEAELWSTGSKAVRKMITFARNARKWKHQDGGYLDDIIWDNMGQWSHPGQITGITGTKDGTDITMNGVADYLIGKDNLGNVKFMKPGMDYHFPGSSVVEYPIKYQFGGLFKKKETPNYLYTTYGLNSQGDATFTGSYNNPIFGYKPLSGINQSIGRGYSMPDYGAVAIVSEPLYMNEQPSPRQMDLVDLKNRQLFAESRGNERAKSPRGASGLYQIMPDTAKWYADSTGNKGSVWDPTYNEQIRDWLMERLYNYDWAKSAKTDEERWRRAYAGYNWGSGNMSKAISKYGDDWYKHVPKETRDYVTFIIDNVDVGKHTTNEKYNEAKKSNKYFKQYGGLIKPFSYTDIPVVRYSNGGNLFQEAGQIFKRPQDDLTGRNILTNPILPPKSYYEQFTVPELEPKKPQPLQPLEGTYGNKYSELIPMSDGTYVNNPINKGLQQDWRTHALEFTPFLAIGAGPAIGSTATWLASKPALYNFGRMTLGSEIGGRSVDLASRAFTGNTWGQNVGNVVEDITGLNPNNTMVGQFVTDATNPGNYFDLSRLWKTGLATSPLITRRNHVRQTDAQTNNSGSDFDIEEARNMIRSFEPDYTSSQSSGYRTSQSELPRELLEDLDILMEQEGLQNIHGTYNRTDTPTITHILEDFQNNTDININPNILTTQAKFPRLTSRYRSFIGNNQTIGNALSRLKYTLNEYKGLKPNLRKGQIEDTGHVLWGKLHKPQDGKDITGLAYFHMSPKRAVERAKTDMARIPIGSRFILDYAGATSHNSYPLALHMMNSYVSPNFNVKPSKFFGLQRMIPLNDMGFATDDVLKSTNRNIIRLNKDRGLNLPQAYLKDGTMFVPAVYAERMYGIGGYLNDLIPYYG